MNRLTKFIYFGLLSAIALLQIYIGGFLLGLGLLLLATFGMWVFEKRELKRLFYRALRKLYVCADLDGFSSGMLLLKKNAIFKRESDIPLKILEGIQAYYTENREEALRVFTSVDTHRDYAFWQWLYLGFLKSESDVQKANMYLEAIPSSFRQIAKQQLDVYRAIYVNNDAVEQLDALREHIEYNLLLAQLLKAMSEKSANSKLSDYYKKASENLGKKLVL